MFCKLNKLKKGDIMMTKRFVVITRGIFVVTLCLINLHCYTPDPEKLINLNVPYHQQVCSNWCGLACVQMWADFDYINVTQQEIASYIGIDGNDTANAFELLIGVGAFTCSAGHVETRDSFEPGSQGDLISATIYAIQDSVPSIMPFFTDHAVLIKGYKWREDESGKPFALNVWYHDPNGFANRNCSGGSLRSYFMPCPFDYWVLVGDYYYIDEGIDGHDAFVMEWGTYYGGPAYYNPKGLYREPIDHTMIP
jgi:hypothetical protein